MPKMATQIRLEDETHEKLKAIAEREMRSLNAQMEYFILRSIEKYLHDNPSFEIRADNPKRR